MAFFSFFKSRDKTNSPNSQYPPVGMTNMGDFDDSDIFIAGFPKSGNTWMQHMMTGVAYGLNMKLATNILVRDLTPDVHQRNTYKRYLKQMVFKTHHLPRPEYKNVIFLVRDPRDAINSFYQMERGRGKDITIKEIVDTKKGLTHSWDEHVRTWLENPFKSKIVMVRYESLLKNPLEEMQRIINMFGLEINHQLLIEIIQNCAFGSMRLKEESGLWGKGQEWSEGKFFVRKGKEGSYATDLSSDEIKHIESKYKEVMTKVGYE